MAACPFQAMGNKSLEKTKVREGKYVSVLKDFMWTNQFPWHNRGVNPSDEEPEKYRRRSGTNDK